MTSTLSWLDFSEVEQRRSREMVQLFMQRESRDELGIGVVRDAFSNSMFPGVSVIQTRARYFLFIPWLYTKGGETGRDGQRLLSWVDKSERALIETIRKGGDEEGLIGREAGTKVKILPSTIYWNGLLTYGVLRWPGSREQVASALSRPLSLEDALTEQVDRTDSPWDPHLPARPAGFPNVDALDFVLSDDEAVWLRERIMSGARGTLLEWMVAHRVTPGDTLGPWDEPWVGGLPEALRRTVHHAELFSLVMQGAALRYNAMLADRCAELGFAQSSGAELFAELLQGWQDEMERHADRFATWSLDDFWALVTSVASGRISSTRGFVTEWVSLIASNPAAVNSKAAYDLIHRREETQKRGQARLINERLLRQWGGAAGITRLVYRWGQVQRMLRDINQEADDAGA